VSVRSCRAVSNNNQSEVRVKEQDAVSGRREFLTTAGAVAATIVSGFPAIISAQTVTNSIKVGLVGSGGRGTGAAAQALQADDYAELTAVADIDQSRIDDSLRTLGKKPIAGRLKVDKSKEFLGLDAYQKLIDSGVDVVILTTPPGFRPVQLAACIDANKHVFCEKPIATDAPGVRSVLATTEKARQKNLSLVSGFCWRYNAMTQEAFQKIHDGEIGRLVAYYANYYTNPVKPMPPESLRPAGMSDTEWQIRNWYNFVWVCGDSLVEQAVHSADKIAWAMNDEPPISCAGVGGREIPNETGNIFDHFAINYLYPNGVRAFLANRQDVGCFNENADYIMGSEGSCHLNGSMPPRIEGKNPWTWTGQKYDMYQKEHDELFASIRKHQPINNGKRMATSTLLAMMGRMAAYTGQQITWDQALNSQEVLVPEHLDWHGSLPIAPRAKPGVTKFV
jgi:myo-inositol 2-dehydrogenase/D-chiro-inositol 1-dehydrogenase